MKLPERRLRDDDDAIPTAAAPAAETPAGDPPVAMDLPALWDAVIRAHFLGWDLADPCGRSGLPSAAAARMLGTLLRQWATVFGAELEAVESDADRRRRR